MKPRRITCPYHAWTYQPAGRADRRPDLWPAAPVRAGGLSALRPADHRMGRLRLCLPRGRRAAAIRPFFDEDLDGLANWPLADLAVGATHRWVVACNWKIFWENYSECLHCPAVHPGLSRMVPIYGRGILGEQDDPDWQLSPSPTIRNTRAACAAAPAPGRWTAARPGILSRPERGGARGGLWLCDRTPLAISRRPHRLCPLGARPAAQPVDRGLRRMAVSQGRPRRRRGRSRQYRAVLGRLPVGRCRGLRGEPAASARSGTTMAC